MQTGTGERKGRGSAPKRIAWEEIQDLLRRGYEPRDIALRLGCSTQNVYERIKRREGK